MTKAIGWYATETIKFGFSSTKLDPATNMAEARGLVAAGTHRWVNCQASTLTLAPIDYKLKRWEHFLKEEVPGCFIEVID